jgi:phosphatidylinositol alpha-1,6-mannosyltransferase
MPLRVIFVSHSLPPSDGTNTNIGGMQRVALDLHRALSVHQGIEYEPIVMRSSWTETHRRVVPFLVRTLRTLRRRVYHDQVDVILYSSMVSASLDTLLGRARRRRNVKAAAIVHGLDVTTDLWVYQKFVPRVFSSLDLVMPVSRATGEACVERGLPSTKVCVVPNGVDVGRFAFPAEADFAARPADRPSLEGLVDDHVLSRASLVLCSVGRHVARKGFDWFASEVMPRLPDDVIYVLAGEGPMTQQIKEAALASGVQDRVILVGRVSEEDLRRLYAGADLFVMPNIPVKGDMEGFGVVMLESGLSGAPAIAAGIEGILDVVAEGENGILVPTGNTEAFVKAVMGFHGAHTRVVQAAERARRYTAATFSWEAVANRYVDELTRLCAA